MRSRHTLCMATTPPSSQEEKRLIILLPADLLEGLRQAAENADLSVSQVVRRAIRNELQSIANQKTNDHFWESLRKGLSSSERVPLSTLANMNQDRFWTLFNAFEKALQDRQNAPSAKLSDLSGGVTVPNEEQQRLAAKV